MGKMEHIKDLLNFNTNKKYKIIIIVLVIIIIFMQTGLSMTNKKIRILSENTKKLNEKIKDYQTASINNEVKNIDELITSKTEEREEVGEAKSDFLNKKDILIDKFKEIGSLENKIYNENIIEGKKHLIFESINLEMTDNQITSAFKNITSEEFNIEIKENKLAESRFFKIYLIEKN